MNIGERIKFIRKSCEITQQEFAVRLGVSQRTVSHWEGGESLPSVVMLLKIRDEFGVSFGFFGERRLRES